MIEQISIELLVSLIIFLCGVLVGQVKSIRKFIKKFSDKRYAEKNGKIKQEFSDYEVINKVVEKFKKTGSYTMGEARTAVEAATNLEKQGKTIDDPEQVLLLKEITEGLIKMNNYFSK